MIEYIMVNKSAQIHELAARFSVSEATVRRDLDDLDRQGLIKRTHGGAIKLDRSTSFEHVYSEKLNLMPDVKHRLAKRAAAMVQNGDTVLIDAGTTTYYIAQALVKHEELTLITNDLYIAHNVQIHPSSTLIVTGGTRRQGRQELVGSLTENFIRESHVNVAFIGADGIDVEHGVTNANFAEVGIKRLMLAAGMRTVLAVDHSKFGKVALAKVCDMADFTTILTDSGLDDDMLEQIARMPVELVMV